MHIAAAAERGFAWSPAACPNAEIGWQQMLARTHVARVLVRIGVRDRVQAVLAAYESGLVEPGATD